jgi:hypothetical protein
MEATAGRDVCGVLGALGPPRLITSVRHDPVTHTGSGNRRRVSAADCGAGSALLRVPSQILSGRDAVAEQSPSRSFAGSLCFVPCSGAYQLRSVWRHIGRWSYVDVSVRHAIYPGCRVLRPDGAVCGLALPEAYQVPRHPIRASFCGYGSGGRSRFVRASVGGHVVSLVLI